MRNWSLPVGHLFGVEFRIHLTFLFLLFFVLVTQPDPHPASMSLRGLALVGIIFACVVLHESAHAILGMMTSVPAKTVVLLPIGGVTLMDETRQPAELVPSAWVREIRNALAGPLMNLLVALIAGGIILEVAPKVQLWQHPFLYYGNLPRSFFWANIGLAVLNLLPAYPLDGGRVLRAIFTRSMDPVRATRRAVSIGQTVASVFMLTGMLMYLQGSSPYSTWLTMAGFFLFIAAQLEERSAVFQSVLETVHLEDIMLTDFATLSPADTLEDALDKAVHTLQDDFPVIRGTDMVGVISKRKILEALRAEGNGYVQSAMVRIFEVAQKTESLAAAFRKLTSRNLSLIPIVEDQRLIGIITLQNLMHSMALLAESRKLRKEALNS